MPESPLPRASYQNGITIPTNIDGLHIWIAHAIDLVGAMLDVLTRPVEAANRHLAGDG